MKTSPDLLRLHPYPGPRPFEPEQQDIFFGRDREIADIVSLIISHRVMLLYAPSGAGKTSLLNAGVISRLTDEGFQVLPVARVRVPIPQDADLGKVANIYVFNTLMNWVSDKALMQSLYAKELVHSLNEQFPSPQNSEPLPRVIIFDQFEELFTFYPERWADREGFFLQVAQLLDSDPLCRVLFVMREDYIANLDRYTHLLPENLRARFRLELMRADAAESAITGPLRITDCIFAEGVPAHLVQELLKIRVQSQTNETIEATGEFVEPVQLQVVCENLWVSLPPGTREITEDHLQKFGDVDDALKGFYERAVGKTIKEAKVHEGTLRQWFDKDLITSVATRGTVIRGKTKTGILKNQAVDYLENEHLIRGETRAGARWYELTHDRFIKPIQLANLAWRQRRQRRRLIIGFASLLALLVIAYASLIAMLGQFKFDNAVEVVTDSIAITINPNDEDAYFYRALAYRSLNNDDQALADINKAIELDPNSYPNYSVRGRLYLNQKKYDQAIADYTKQIELYPGTPNYYIYSARGDAYQAKGDLTQAIDDFTKAIELDPTVNYLYKDRGVAYRQKGINNQAIADFQMYLQLSLNAYDRSTVEQWIGELKAP